MVNCVILYRINGGPVQAVSFGDDGRPEEFDNMDAAVYWHYAGLADLVK